MHVPKLVPHTMDKLFKMFRKGWEMTRSTVDHTINRQLQGRTDLFIGFTATGKCLRRHSRYNFLRDFNTSSSTLKTQRTCQLHLIEKLFRHTQTDRWKFTESTETSLQSRVRWKWINSKSNNKQKPTSQLNFQFIRWDHNSLIHSTVSFDENVESNSWNDQEMFLSL